MAYKQKGWSAYTPVSQPHGNSPRGFVDKFREPTTPEQKEKYAEQERAGIQRKIDRKTKAVERKEAKGSTWGLKRKKRKISNLEEAKKKADGSFTEQVMEMHNREKGIEDERIENMRTHNRPAPFTKKDDKKEVKIPTKSPAETVKRLQAKKDAGTATATELKKLRELRKLMETGPGSYGNEEWDKE